MHRCPLTVPLDTEDRLARQEVDHRVEHSTEADVGDLLHGAGAIRQQLTSLDDDWALLFVQGFQLEVRRRFALSNIGQDAGVHRAIAPTDDAAQRLDLDVCPLVVLVPARVGRSWQVHLIAVAKCPVLVHFRTAEVSRYCFASSNRSLIKILTPLCSSDQLLGSKLARLVPRDLADRCPPCLEELAIAVPDCSEGLAGLHRGLFVLAPEQLDGVLLAVGVLGLIGVTGVDTRSHNVTVESFHHHRARFDLLCEVGVDASWSLFHPSGHGIPDETSESRDLLFFCLFQERLVTSGQRVDRGFGCTTGSSLRQLIKHRLSRSRSSLVLPDLPAEVGDVADDG